MRLLNKIYLLLLISLSLGLKAQNYQERQKQLEAQKISIKNEIQQINNLINASRKKSTGLAAELEDIQLKISVRDRLIRINNSQVNNLNNIISNQNERIADLEVDLKKLKDEYSKIRKMNVRKIRMMNIRKIRKKSNALNQMHCLDDSYYVILHSKC